MNKENRENQIKEQRGLWKASSYTSKIAKRLAKKDLPIRIRYIIEAHRILFIETNEKGISGKYRRDNPSLKRLDGSKLKINHWSQVAAQMAILDEDLKTKTSHLKHPTKHKDYAKIINLAAKMSHRLACIHPFENGNGRTSRLLINFILLRAGLCEIIVSENRERYLKAMLQADRGDFIPLIALIIEGVVRFEKEVLKKRKILSIQEDKRQKRLIFRKSDFK